MSVSANRINELAPGVMEDLVEEAQQFCEGRRCGIMTLVAGLVVRNVAIQGAYEQMVAETIVDPETDSGWPGAE